MTRVLPDPFDLADPFDLGGSKEQIAAPAPAKRELHWSDLALPLSPYATPLDVAVRRFNICQDVWSLQGCGYTMRECERLSGADFSVPAASVRRWRKRIEHMPTEDWVPALLDARPVFNIVSVR